ncbi:MAG TPA: hypothetical protein VN366_10860 [Feifaniaceae bacterium]|nr:hypothetical protein [Feifaniaceae bacterium]
MKPYMPMLLLRTRYAHAAVELNGRLIGEASPEGHLVLPLDNDTEYYIGVYPLSGDAYGLYPVVRKLRFQDGLPQPVQSADVELYAWPDSVYEAVLSPGALPAQPVTVFPYTVDQISLPDGCVATLYYDSGLKFAVEGGVRILYGTTLLEGRTGNVSLAGDRALCVVAGEADLPGGDLPEGYGKMLLVLDQSYQEKLRIAGDAVGMQKEHAVSFTRLDTLLMHERKEIYRYTGGEYIKEEPAVGFFTHSPPPPMPGRQLVRAFCEAVLLELWDEALSYLTPALQDGLAPETMRQFFGEFTGVRLPFSRQDKAIGLTYPPKDGVVPVRVFSFTFDGDKIDNITED